MLLKGIQGRENLISWKPEIIELCVERKRILYLKQDSQGHITLELEGLWSLRSKVRWWKMPRPLHFTLRLSLRASGTAKGNCCMWVYISSIHAQSPFSEQPELFSEIDRSKKMQLPNTELRLSFLLCTSYCPFVIFNWIQTVYVDEKSKDDS